MMFEAEEIHKMLAAADCHLAAMLLLGVNCGFGPTDLTTLPESAVNMENGWVAHPRPKTGVYRRAPLWRETVAALHKSLAHTPRLRNTKAPTSFFLSRSGRSYKSGVHCSMLKDGFRVFPRQLNLYRPRLGFYGLRRSFETIAGESIDQGAVNFIMGRSKGDMASVYRQRISDERLQAVLEHVRQWLFPDDGAK